MNQCLPIAAMIPLQMEPNPVVNICIILFLTTYTYFCWWYWKFTRVFAKFPSVRLEARGMLKLMLGRYRKNVPFTCVVFEYVNQVALQFGKEGFLVAWFCRPYLLLFNKKAVKRFYAEPATVSRSRFYDFVKGAVGNGLLTSDEETWKKHRKLLNPVFYVGAIKEKLYIFNDVATKLVTELEKRVDEPTSDISRILKEYTFDMSSQAIFGIKLDGERYREKLVNYFHAVHDSTQGMIYRVGRPWLYWNITLPFFKAGRKCLRAHKSIRSFTMEVLSELKTSLVAFTESGKDLECEAKSKKSIMRVLLEQHLEDPCFTMNDVLDHVCTFFVAGYDTISCTLFFCLYTLGLHPEVQEKAFKEIEALKGTDVTYDDMYELTYLECVIKESLRLYPTVPIIGRKLSTDIQLDECTIPKGTEVVFLLFLLHRDPETFPDPEKFDPERFSGNSEVLPWAFMPFAEGPRNCIGKKFAMIAVKVILTHVIRRLKIETLEKINDSDLDWAMMLEPIKPVRLLFTLR